MKYNACVDEQLRLQKMLARDAPLALFALVALVIQNTSLAILLKLSVREGASPYPSACVVFVSELVKLIICSVVTAGKSTEQLKYTLSTIGSQKLLFVPSCLYVIQNNLLFFGAKLLPSLVYIVCTQTKILTTALMSYTLLGTKFGMSECGSLFFLAIGIVLVQNSQSKNENPELRGSLSTQTIGVCSVLLASLTSGTAGIVLEKIYKQGGANSDSRSNTVWTRNVQLGLISLPIALLGVWFQSPKTFESGNFTEGFDAYVWAIVACQVAGGVIIAYVMKYASNILKCLAVAISICCCAVYSVAMGDVEITGKLSTGIFTVVTAVFAFSKKHSIRLPVSLQIPK